MVVQGIDLSSQIIGVIKSALVGKITHSGLSSDFNFWKVDVSYKCSAV